MEITIVFGATLVSGRVVYVLQVLRVASGFQEDQALQLSQLRAHAVKKSEENDAPVDTNEILGANKQTNTQVFLGGIDNV